jgi:UDP-2,3-diacylglucosamine hydrolase
LASFHHNGALGLPIISAAEAGSKQDYRRSFLGDDKEWLLIYCQETLKARMQDGSKKNIDFFVFGHRHLPIDYRLNDKSRYINLGDWISFYTYAVFDGADLKLNSFKGKEEKIIRK